MKNFKKILVCSVTAVLLAVIGITTFFAETYYEFDHFIFLKNSDGTITVSDYDNSSSNVSIPETILDKTVSGIDSFAFFKKYNNNFCNHAKHCY